MPRAEYEPIFEAAAKEWNVDPNLLRAVATQESGGKPAAVSRAGAVGVMQIMPKTGLELGLVNPTDATQSIWAGAKYLSQQLDKYKRPELALAAYNAGPGRVDAFLKGGALPDETMKYVPAVTAHYHRIKGTVAERKPSAPMSDDEFLKSTGAVPGGAKQDNAAPMSDDEFLKATGAAPGSAKPAPKDRQQGTLDDPQMPQRFQKRTDMAPRKETPVDAGRPLSELREPLGRIGGAVAQGFSEGSQPMPGLVTPLFERLGIYPPAEGGGTLLQGANKLAINPIATAGEGLLRAFGGAFRGAQAGVAQAGAEAGQPGLGRDLAALPEAFMGAPGGVRPQAPRNRLAPATEAPRVAMEPPLPPGVEFVPGASGSKPRYRVRADAAEQPAPRSAGAAATPEPVAEMPRPEMIAQRARAENDRLREPQPTGPDTNTYIPGVQTTEAQMIQTANAAREEKSLAIRKGDDFKRVQRENNEKRVDYWKDTVPSEVQVLRMEEARDAQAATDAQAAFGRKKPVDATPVLQAADDILSNPQTGEMEAVRKYVAPIREQLFDGETLKTDPERLYGIRRNITAKLSKMGKVDEPGVALAEKELLSIRDALDNVIEQGAPGFAKFRENYAKASQAIDEANILHQNEKTIYNSSNQITYNGVQRMLARLVEARSQTGVHPAHHVSDATMQRLFALRDDLRRVASADELAAVKGSDTVQNTWDMLRGIGGTAGAEFAGNMVTGIPFVGGALARAAVSGVQNMRDSKALQRALNPDIEAIKRLNRLAPPPE